MLTKHLAIFLFLIGNMVCVAQENEFLRGKVLDSKTGEPVVFATVRIVGKAKGVITNMDGGFRLPLNYRETGESIEISSMGYDKKTYELRNLLPREINIIYLDAGMFNLSEAVVSAKKKKKLSARKIVERAIENIPNNYPNHNFSTLGYYRDYQLDSIGYINLNEAILEVFDQGFKAIDTATTKVLIYDYMQNQEFRRDTISDNPYNYRRWDKVIDNAYIPDYGGNELAILRVHDPIRNFRINSFDFINNLWDGDLIKNHSLHRAVDTYIEGKSIYTIEMKKTYPGYTSMGTLYIEPNNYAIHKLEYAVYDDRKRNNDSILRKQGIKGELIFKVIVEYKRQADENMYPNYISLSNTFRLKLPPKFMVSDFLVSAPDNAFIIKFNNKLGQEENIEKLSNYNFWYQGRKIHLKKASRLDDHTIWVYPKLNGKGLNKMYNRLLTMNRKGQELGTVFVYELSNLRDEEGNLINALENKGYVQFREYFVQEPKLYGETHENDSLYLMNKNKPIFENQPIRRPVDFGNYWMNTPLSKLNN